MIQHAPPLNRFWEFFSFCFRTVGTRVSSWMCTNTWGTTSVSNHKLTPIQVRSAPFSFTKLTEPFEDKLKHTFQSYFSLYSGTLSAPVETRGIATGIQFAFLIISFFLAFQYTWLLSGSIYFYPFFLLIIVSSWVGIFYWCTAFFFSLRESVPRMVKSRSKLGLFFFTLLFFESLVLSLLLWVMTFVFYLTDTWLCVSNQYICRGVLRSLVSSVTTISILTGLVIYRVNKKSGIGFRDAIGLDQ